jgi:Ca2+-binding EF-hand superfamily protein
MELSQQFVADIFRWVDRDNSGLIERPEFIDFMTRIGEERHVNILTGISGDVGFVAGLMYFIGGF